MVIDGIGKVDAGLVRLLDHWYDTVPYSYRYRMDNSLCTSTTITVLKCHSSRATPSAEVESGNAAT